MTIGFSCVYVGYWPRDFSAAQLPPGKEKDGQACPCQLASVPCQGQGIRAQEGNEKEHGRGKEGRVCCTGQARR